jgi:signal transduction histidine kinase
VIIRILNPESAQAELLMLVPLFFEIAFYLDTRWSAGLNLALVLAVAFANSVSWPLDTPRLPAADIFPRMLLEAGAMVTAALLIRYRETIVDHQRQLANLHNAVASLSTANHAFQVYADSMEFRSAEKERNRITRELHDSVGYALTNIIMMMNAGKVLCREDSSKLPELFEEARRQADDALRENRRILYRLREIQEMPEGLLKIRHLAKVFSEATGIEIETSFGNLPLTISDRIDSLLYRVVQEGLTNAFRHGKATKIAISFWNDEKELRVSLRDNGLGAEVIQEGIGLKGMKERLEEFGGTLRAYNVPDGFNLGVSIPRINLGQFEKDKL